MPETEATPVAPPKGEPARPVPPAASLNDTNDPPAAPTDPYDRQSILTALADARKAAAAAAPPEPDEPEEAPEAPATLAQDVQARAEETDPPPPGSSGEQGAPAVEAPPPVVADEKSKRLRRLLDAKAELGAVKDEATQAREAARAIVVQATQEAQTAAQKIIADAQTQAQAMVRQAIDELRTRPAQAAARLGIDPAQLLAQQADDADPLAVMGRKFEGELTARDKKLEDALKIVETLKRQDQERTQYLAHVQRTTAQTNFLKTSEATSKAKGPDGVETEVETYLFASVLWSKDELLRRADDVIKKGVEAARKQGEAFDIDDTELLSYLNEEAEREFTARLNPKISKLTQLVGSRAEKAAAIAKGTPGKPANGAPAKAAATAPAGSGQKPRTVSGSSGERRAPPNATAVEELSDAEFRKQAVRKVKEARRQATE